MSFAMHVHLYNCHHNQDIEHSHDFSKIPHAHLQSMPVLTPPYQSSSRATTSLCSVTISYFLPIPEFHVKGILQYVILCYGLQS